MLDLWVCLWGVCFVVGLLFDFGCWIWLVVACAVVCGRFGGVLLVAWMWWLVGFLVWVWFDYCLVGWFGFTLTAIFGLRVL